jgi:transcriptional regulator with XRE-family HTH domain
MSQRIGETEREFYVELGHRIRDQRRLKSIGQASVALECGCTDSLISHFESGRARPSLYQLWRIAPAIGTTVAELLGFDNVARQLRQEIERWALESAGLLADRERLVKAIADVCDRAEVALTDEDGTHRSTVQRLDALEKLYNDAVLIRDTSLDTLNEITAGVVTVLERRARA